MEADCIFCKIASGAIPGAFAHRDRDVIAIADVNPQAPTHLLVMPVAHVPNLAALVASGDAKLLRQIFDVAARLGAKQGRDGFRAVINTGREGGQSVDHLHVHVLAGRQMEWPPG